MNRKRNKNGTLDKGLSPQRKTNFIPEEEAKFLNSTNFQDGDITEMW